MKFGVVPDFTNLPKPKHIAHAAISALRYFSSVPPVSHELLNVCVANSWPLPYSGGVVLGVEFRSRELGVD